MSGKASGLAIETMLTREKEESLEKIYFDPKQPTSFGGVDKLYKFMQAKGKDISRGDIKKWLSKQTTYSLYRKAIRKFKRPKVIVPSKQYLWDSDTINYGAFQKENDGFKYIAVFIDILSHYLYTVPLKSLKSKDMVEALKMVLQEGKPSFIRTDRGPEFAGSADKYMKSQDVKHITTSEHSKANYAERVIRTIKGKLGRYMAYNKTRKWIDALPDITESYNNTYHRTIKMSPREALSTPDPILWTTQYRRPELEQQQKKTTTKPVKIKKRLREKKLYKFKPGDVVRLSRIPGRYDKESDKKWTDELFRVTSRSLNQGIPKYEVKDFANDPIIDKFSSDELQKVIVDQDTQYDTDKIIRKRKRKGKTQVLVHWVGWPSKFDSWIDEEQVKDFTA